jgi:hypothetical protein
MPGRIVAWIAGLLCLAAVARSEPATAAQVVVRGKRKLHDALLAGLRPLLATRSGPVPVAVVVDVTPYTADDQERIHLALQRLLTTLPGIRDLTLARLGDPPIRRGDLFAEPSNVTSTVLALRRSLRGFKEPKGCVLFLADWHFEDDEDLERFIKDLKRRQQGFSVVGSEACFGRGWNDGFFPPHRSGVRPYDERIGRDPFGPRSPGAPWHGGETALPHLPSYFNSVGWQTLFPAERRPPPRTWQDHLKGRAKPGSRHEDVRERLGADALDKEAAEVYSYPLPSGFGPYGLMRAAAETGGRYVIWSWNPEGRSLVRYRYGRCDLFAPDLKSRSEILRDIKSRPIARALLEAWHAVANDRVAVAGVTPPIDERDGMPEEMVEARGRLGLSWSWYNHGEHARFLKAAEQMIDACSRAEGILEGALNRGPIDPVDRRYFADAELFRHTLLVHRFSIGEARGAASTLPKNAWRDRTRTPGLDPLAWIRPEFVEGAIETELVELHDAALAGRVIKERRRFLDRFRGTPFGELVARNGVGTHQLSWSTHDDGDKPGRGTPAAADTQPGPTSPPGNSTPGPGPRTK